MSPWTVVAAALLGAAVYVLLGSDRRPAQSVDGAESVDHAEPLDGAKPLDGAETVGHGEPVGAVGRDGVPQRGDQAASAGESRDRPVGAVPGLRRITRGLRAPGSTAAKVVDGEVSSALALLALAYRSGLPTWDVLEAVATGLDGPASRDLRQVAAALRWGADEAEAWASVGPAWAPAARAVAIAHHAGVPPGAMLLAASDDLRDAELERLELSAAKVGVRLVAPLGLVLLPAFCLTTVAPLVIALAGDVLRG